MLLVTVLKLLSMAMCCWSWVGSNVWRETTQKYSGGRNAADPSELDVEQFDIYDHLMTEEDI
jgi:hypothetical protein